MPYHELHIPRFVCRKFSCVFVCLGVEVVFVVLLLVVIAVEVLFLPAYRLHCFTVVGAFQTDDCVFLRVA